jgi:hypothetical protein
MAPSARNKNSRGGVLGAHYPTTPRSGNIIGRADPSGEAGHAPVGAPVVADMAPARYEFKRQFRYDESTRSSFRSSAGQASSPLRLGRFARGFTLSNVFSRTSWGG